MKTAIRERLIPFEIKADSSDDIKNRVIESVPTLVQRPHFTGIIFLGQGIFRTFWLTKDCIAFSWNFAPDAGFKRPLGASYFVTHW